MKLAVIGGAGVRAMFLAKSLVQRAKELNIQSIVFMDNSEENLNIYGEMARQVALRIDDSVNFTLTTDAVEAVTNADYIITTIRAGQDKARMADEKIALKRKVLGQETTGAAGFSFAMRSVPALVEYCELVKKHAKKDAKVFNFTNPAGIVSQVLRDLGYDFTFGICDAPTSLLDGIADLYDATLSDMETECFGLNHLSFFSSVRCKGQELMPEIMDNDKLYTDTEMRFFDKGITKQFGYLLNEYFYYYLYPEIAVENILKAGKGRGEIIYEINRKMKAELSTLDIAKDFDTCIEVFEKWYGERSGSYMSNETGVGHKTKPYAFDINSTDSGGYASVALKYIESMQKGFDTTMVLCIPNNGAIPELKDDDTIEVSCVISPKGITPHSFSNIDEVTLEYIHRVKIYERLASKALRTKSIQTAIQALALNPLVGSYSLATELMSEFTALNELYTTGWK